MSRRAKSVRLGQRLTRAEMQRANAVLSAHDCACVSAGRHGKLPIVAALLTPLNGLGLGKAAHVLKELTWALDGGKRSTEA